MKTVFFKLPSEVDYLNFVDKLIRADIESHQGVKYMGEYRLAGRCRGSNTRYLFSLISGATVVSPADEKAFIEISTNNREHTRETRTLLSQLTGIPTNKFKIVA